MGSVFKTGSVWMIWFFSKLTLDQNQVDDDE
jgi:hypothetical protein